MSIVGIVLMWGCLAAAFAIVTRWSMGQECDRRQAYWAKYEGK